MLRRRSIDSLAILFLIGFAVLHYFIDIHWWYYALVILSWFLITLYGSFFIGWNYHMNSLHQNKKIKRPWVSITFDDGPNEEFTLKILRLLRAYGAKATFFCIGRQLEAHPQIVKKIIADGHSVGNHTYSHSNRFGFFRKKKVIEELKKTKAIINGLTGKDTKLYRPAFGVTNPMIEKAVRHLKLISVGWSIRSLDTTKLSEDKVFQRITAKVSKGDIILLHDTSEKCVAVLERLLVFLENQNLQSVTVEELMEIDAHA